MNTCPSFDQVVDYWLGELADADAFEDHLFGCDDCPRRLARLAAIGAAVPDAIRRRGGVALALTGQMAARLEREGVVMRHYRPERNQDVACTVALEDDLSVSWLLADPRPGERVDYVAYGPDGALRGRIQDVPVDPTIGRIVLAIPSESLRSLPACELRHVVMAVGPAGERPLGEYIFRHTPMPR